jgi:hypothetical protein
VVGAPPPPGAEVASPAWSIAGDRTSRAARLPAWAT